MALICAVRGPGMFPPTRDNVEMCRGFLLPSYNPYATRYVNVDDGKRRRGRGIPMNPT